MLCRVALGTQIVEQREKERKRERLVFALSAQPSSHHSSRRKFLTNIGESRLSQVVLHGSTPISM